MDKLTFTNKVLSNLNDSMHENGKVKLDEFIELTNNLYEALNYSQCCAELPMIEELIISEIRRKHQKQIDDEVQRFLSNNGTDCRLRGFFSEPDLNE